MLVTGAQSMVFTCAPAAPLPITMAKSVRLQFAGCDSMLFDFNYFYGKDVTMVLLRKKAPETYLYKGIFVELFLSSYTSGSWFSPTHH